MQLRRSFTYSHRERPNAPPKREKYLRIWKIPSLVLTGNRQIIGCFWKIFYPMKITPSLIWTKGAEMHTHFRVFLEKFFEKKIYPSLIWNYKAKWHPISQEKWENIFSGCGMAYFYLPKKSLHLFGIGKLKRTLFLRKIWKNIFSACGMTCFTWTKSFHLFGIWVSKRNLFLEIFENFFKSTFCLKNILSLVPAGKGLLGTVILKKVKKICPPEVASKEF